MVKNSQATENLKINSINFIEANFVLEFSPHLLLQMMNCHQLKAMDLSGDFSFDLQRYKELINKPPFFTHRYGLNHLLQVAKDWPAQINWSQFNSQIKLLLHAWLKDYKLGSDFDLVFLFAQCLSLHPVEFGYDEKSLPSYLCKNSHFQALIMHLLARATNQFNQYKIDYAQNFDIETGLPNQHSMLHFLSQHLQANSENIKHVEDQPENDVSFSSGTAHIGLMLINLNINYDDALLKATSFDILNGAISVIKKHLNSDSTLFIINSNELAVVITDLNFSSQLNIATSKIMHAFEFELPLENFTLILKPYFGCVSAQETHSDAITFTDCAKLALHHAMINNEQSKFYDNKITAFFADTYTLDEDIIEAFHQNELELYLQPIVSLSYDFFTENDPTGKHTFSDGRNDKIPKKNVVLNHTNKTEIFASNQDVSTQVVRTECISAELLLRWQNKECQTVSPQRMLDAIYKKGFGKMFIRWLVNNACQRVAEFMSVHQINFTLTFNLSGSDLLDDDLPELLAQTIALWQIPAENLILEITENDLLIDEAKALLVINKIVVLGCTFAIDDFGTGYSSMTRLKNLPIDLVKIDQTFVRNITTSKQDSAIVQSVINLAHSLGKIVAAEGVEDKACLNLLTEMKCEKIQGYYYAKPMQFDDFIVWLNSFKSNMRKANKTNLSIS